MSAHARFLVGSLLLAWFAAGCSTQGSASVATPLPVVADLGGVKAEGRLEPVRFVQLAPAISGPVGEVFVSEGDQVAAGQLLARIESGEGQTLEQARNAAASDLGAAYDAVRAAQKKLDAYPLPVVFVGLTAEEATRKWLGELDAAREAFAPYKDTSRKTLKPRGVLNEFVYPSMPRRVVVDTKDYDDVAQVFKKRVDLAWSNYTKAVLWLNLQSELAAAEARVAEAQRRYESLRSAPTLSENQFGLQTALSTAELRAPFAGTVTRMDLKVGEVASAGTPVVTIADLSSWVVKTTDLTEIDVPAISAGMPATVEFDALPDLELNGRVVSIDLNYVDRQGDVLYPADVLIAESNPRLRWGMTAEVTFGG